MTHRLVKTRAPARPRLDALLAAATARPMTPGEEAAQRRSFVYGNVALANPSVTQEMVAEADERLAKPRLGDWMQMYTGTGKGAAFWPLDPRASEVSITSIAHALGMLCRYNGHCIEFYSVAEHSVHIARWIMANGGNRNEGLWGLLHDAPEGEGIADIIRPVKPFVPGYKGMEHAVMEATRAHFGLSLEEPAIVKVADNRILVDEMLQNMEEPPMPWHLPEAEPLGIELQFWSPKEAENEFHATFCELY